MNPRTRRIFQKGLAVLLYLLAFLVVVVAFLPLGIQLTEWWPKLGFQLPYVDIPWWPVVRGIPYSVYYLARVFLTIAIGLTIFLPQVEATFVSMLRRSSPIGAGYVDRKDFTCANCGTFNRPTVRFCVKCGEPISVSTPDFGRGSQGGLYLVMKFLLTIAAIFAFFLALFDVTLLSVITGGLGLSLGVIFVGTILSVIPSIAAFAALKEGILRKFGTLKQFDRLVFGNILWMILGLFFIFLAAANFLILQVDRVGYLLLGSMEMTVGLLLVLHLLLRRTAKLRASFAS